MPILVACCLLNPDACFRSKGMLARLKRAPHTTLPQAPFPKQAHDKSEHLLCRYLVIKKAWPSSMRTLSGDHERFETTYFKVYPGYYFTGDGCRRDKDGYYWLIGGTQECQKQSDEIAFSWSFGLALFSNAKGFGGTALTSCLWILAYLGSMH